ncbi:MAG: DUF883 C-terminal domain-containing protein [Puniceicoccales bacterium]|nr:DUF883 C-terminal domain-containing protein [Puniceicoccales bacterium]
MDKTENFTPTAKQGEKFLDKTSYLDDGFAHDHPRKAVSAAIGIGLMPMNLSF